MQSIRRAKRHIILQPIRLTMRAIPQFHITAPILRRKHSNLHITITHDQQSFTTKTNTIATPTASMTKKQKTSRALRGSSQNTIAAIVRNSAEMIHIAIIIDITISHPPFFISPIKFLKIKIMVIPKTVIQVNKIHHWNPAATHYIIHLESVINPAVVAWMLTPPKTTV